MNSGTFILGALNGLIIALLAVGFVLVYKANRFLNLAQAQLGAVSAMLLAKFVSDDGWNFWVALVACLALGIATGLVVERFLVRPVRAKSKSPVRLMILTIGVSQLLLALTYIPGVAPTTDVPFPQPFTSTWEVGGVVLSGMSIMILIVVPILLAALAVFLGYTSIGRQIRAAAGNPDAARLCGISVNRVSFIAWGVAGGLSALAAILSGPTATSFNAAALGPFLLMLTMGAAAFGAFTSIPIAVAGGLGLGLTYQVVLAETSNAGTAELWVFGVILLVVVARGRAIGRVFATEGAAVPERPRVRVPTSLRTHPLFGHGRWWLIGGALLVTVVAPQLSIVSSEGNRFLLTLVLVYALVGVSLTMLVGWAGQVSLGHWAVVGLAAYITARWSGHGWTLPAMIIVIGLIGAAVMVVIGLPALRIPGLTLAVTTLGFAVIAPDWLYLQHRIGGDTPFTTFVEFPSVARGLGDADSKQYLYYVALIVLVLAVAAAAALRRSAIGRTIIAVRDNERASAALGIQPAIVKLRVLGVSGFVAAAAGVLYATAWQRVTPLQFGADISIAILAIPVIGGLGSIGGAVAAAVMLYASTFFIGPHVSGLFGDLGQNVGFLLFIGGIGVVGGMLNFPNGIAGKVQEAWQARLDRKAQALEGGAPASDEAPVVMAPVSASDEPVIVDAVVPTFALHAGRVAADDPGTPPLVVRGVAVRFGGVAALDGVDIEVGPGEIVGLIGPNGAGKTTLMNVVSGAIRPNRGSIRVFGHELCGRSPQARARLGVARSFQDASSFAGLTVTEAVQLALARQGKTGLLPALIGAPWVRAAERDSRHRAEQIVDAFGLGPWADALTAELSTGTRRVCELAVQVATEPRLLLLDEPTAGVAQRDAEAFGPLMRRIRDELDCAILVIEHDMPLLMGLCDRAYAMEAGRVIAEGTPTELRNDPIVIASYLGTDIVATNRSDLQVGDPSRVAP